MGAWLLDLDLGLDLGANIEAPELCRGSLMAFLISLHIGWPCATHQRNGLGFDLCDCQPQTRALGHQGECLPGMHPAHARRATRPQTFRAKHVA